MVWSGSEKDVQAWLETLDASERTTLETMPTATIVPGGRREESVRRASKLLAQLAERGRPVELRTGKVIGEGGMGVVREAEQVALGRVVAVKTLKPTRVDPAAAGDLLREAWITGALEHPSIVPVHHLEIDDQLRPLLILKRVDGMAWHELCANAGEVQRRFGASDLLAWNLGILNQVLNALRFAHSRRIIHRDLKPSNVMIGNFGEVYLLDWGIAASLDEDPAGRFPHISETGSDIAGTPAYMAPEMLGLDGSATLSERTDVYLAGAVLFELIAGHPPHRGTHAVAVIASVMSSKPTLPSETPAELAAICTRAMQPDPTDRYPSVEALQQAIARYLDHRGSLRLLAGAQTELDALVGLARAASPAQREEIYRRLAICRFGFHEALAAWRDNTHARDGLTGATVAVAEYELACGDPRAAVTLLAEVGTQHALYQRARAAADAIESRHRALEQLAKDADPTIDRRTRMTFGILTAAFVALPLISALRSNVGLGSHELAAGWAFASMSIVAALWAWASRAAMTLVNRRTYAAVTFWFAAQLVLALGVWAMGLPVVVTLTLNLLLWGTLCGMFAVNTDRWIGIGALGYFTAFMLATQFPATRMYLTSAANLTLTIVLALRWRPATRSVSDRVREERP